MLGRRLVEHVLVGASCVVVVLLAALFAPRATAPRVAPPLDASLALVVRARLERPSSPDAGATSAPAALPLASARVRLFQEREGRYHPLPEQRTDGAGRLEARLAPGVYWLLVDHDRAARRSASVTLAPGARRELELELTAGEPFEVRVTSELGMPITGATVLVHGADALPVAAATSGEGVALFARVAGPVERVEVSAPGFGRASQTPSAPSVEVVLGAPTVLEVTLHDAHEQPLPGAELWLAGLALWPPEKVIADGRGVARVEGLEPGSYDLVARHEALASELELGVRIERSGHGALTLVLEPGRFITAVVTEGEGKEAPPLADADVVLVEGLVSPFPRRARTDASGKAVLGPFRGRRAVLNVSAPGFVPRSFVEVPASGDAVVRVALARGGRLVGKVTDASGRPVAGASIEVVGDDVYGNPLSLRAGSNAFAALGAAPLALTPAGELGVTSGPLPSPHAGIARALAEGSSDQAWLSDSAGEYRLRDIPPGKLGVIVTHPDYVEAESPIVVLAAGGEARLDVVLGEGARLEGRVVDAAGAPVSGARLEVMGTRSTLHKVAHSDTRGYFSLGGLPKEVVLTLSRPSAPERAVSRRTLELELGERRNIELVLPAERGSVVFDVSDPFGAPLGGAELSVVSLEPRVPLRRTLTSDASGQATLRDAEGLALKVTVELSGFRPLELHVDAAPLGIELSMTRGVSVSGRITHLRGRMPLGGARVVVTQGGVRREGKTDDNGHYRLAALAAGAARLRVSHPDFAPKERELTLHADEGPEIDLGDLDLAEAGGIAGVVLDAEGAPVRGARVGLGVVPAFLPPGPLPEGLVLTDAAGEFQLSGVPEGLVRVSAYAAGLGRGSVDGVEVTEGHVIEGVEIRLHGESAPPRHDELPSLAVTLGERDEGRALEVVIVHVAERSEAQRAGLLAGDVITHVDGAPVRDMQDARARLRGREGSDVVLEVSRRGERIPFSVRRERVRR